METINIDALGLLMIAWAGGADDEDEVSKYRDYNPNSKSDIQALIDREFKPYFDNLPEKKRSDFKLALGYALSSLCASQVDFTNAFYCSLPPFEAPQNPRDFFEIVWQTLFAGEEYPSELPEKTLIISNSSIIFQRY